MKKSLVALAALAATTAFAQSSVVIDGNLDVGYQAIDYKGNKVNGIANGGSSTSGLNIRITEDLGGGLKANIRHESNWNSVFNRANTGAASTYDSTTPANSANAAAGAFGSGEIRLGLSGGFGAIDAGVVNMNSLTSFLTGNPFGTAIGGGYGSVTRVDAAGAAVRADNSVKYTSPNFNGLTLSLYNVTKQTKGSQATNNFSSGLGVSDLRGSSEIGVNYAKGPIAASYSSLKQDNKDVVATTGATAGSTESTVNTLGANYTMGAAKFFLLNQTNKTNTNSTNTSYTGYSASYTMGATTVMAQMGELKDKLDGDKSKMTGIGADYAMSKRTTAYFRTESIKDNAGVVAITGFTAATGNVKRTRTAIGIRHAF
jgi:predicted porin